jgi:2-keto-3-deoxy-galactonokinase
MIKRKEVNCMKLPMPKVSLIGVICLTAMFLGGCSSKNPYKGEGLTIVVNKAVIADSYTNKEEAYAQEDCFVVAVQADVFNPDMMTPPSKDSEALVNAGNMMQVGMLGGLIVGEEIMQASKVDTQDVKIDYKQNMVTGMLWLFYVPNDRKDSDMSFVVSDDMFQSGDLILVHKEFER